MAFAAIACVSVLIEALKDDSWEIHLLAKIPIELLGFVFIANGVTLFLVIIIWLFNRDIKMSQYLNILVWLSFFIMLTQIISVVLNFVRGEK